MAEVPEDEDFEKKKEPAAQEDIVEEIADTGENVEGESNINGNKSGCGQNHLYVSRNAGDFGGMWRGHQGAGI